MTADANGDYTLAWPYGQRVITGAALAVDTASPLFNGLFAMAQDDLRQDSVSAIRDGAFDHGQPIPCHCFETGLKWPYVWTRDLSYSIDLGLWRFDADARAQRAEVQAVRRARAHRAAGLVRDAGHRLGRQLADQHRSRGVVPRRAAPARRQGVCRRRVTRRWATRWRRTGNTPSMRASACTAARPRSWTGASRATRPGPPTRSATSRQSFALSTNVLHYQALQLAADDGRASMTTTGRHRLPRPGRGTEAGHQRALLARRPRHVHELHRRRRHAGRHLRPARHRAGDHQRRGRRRTRQRRRWRTTRPGPPAARSCGRSARTSRSTTTARSGHSSAPTRCAPRAR